MADAIIFHASNYNGAVMKARNVVSQWSPNTTNLADGTKADADSTGRIIQVEYANGIKVRRHHEYCLVQGATLEYWFGNEHGHWVPLD